VPKKILSHGAAAFSEALWWYDSALPFRKIMDLMQFFDMILHVDKTLGTLLAQYGTYVYIVLFAIVFCETGLVVLFFFPGDTLLFIAGAFCATGEMSYPLLMALLIIAAVTGNTLNYYIGGPSASACSPTTTAG
jgi:hypothetical protein